MALRKRYLWAALRLAAAAAAAVAPCAATLAVELPWWWLMRRLTGADLEVARLRLAVEHGSAAVVQGQHVAACVAPQLHCLWLAARAVVTVGARVPAAALAAARAAAAAAAVGAARALEACTAMTLANKSPPQTWKVQNAWLARETVVAWLMSWVGDDSAAGEQAASAH